MPTDDTEMSPDAASCERAEAHAPSPTSPGRHAGQQVSASAQLAVKYRPSVILAIHHVQLAMPTGREPEAEAFYAGLLGIPRVPKPANLESRGGCWFRSDLVEIHLGIEEPFAPASKAHPALLVEDLDELRERLTSSGFSVVPDEPLEAYDRFYAHDPFGNRIELLKAHE